MTFAIFTDPEGPVLACTAMSAVSTCAQLAACAGDRYASGSVPATDIIRSRSRMTSENTTGGTSTSGTGVPPTLPEPVGVP
jgi:hypothetical protein